VILLQFAISGASFFKQSESKVKQNQSKDNITFDTLLKTALCHFTDIMKLNFLEVPFSFLDEYSLKCTACNTRKSWRGAVF